MDYTQVFGGLIVTFIASLAIFSFISGLNTGYADQGVSINTEFHNSFATLNQTLQNIGTSVGENTESDAGATLDAPSEGIISKAWQSLQLLPEIMGLIPALFADAASILGIPSAYTNAAGWLFFFAFGITFAYLLLLGVRRFIS